MSVSFDKRFEFHKVDLEVMQKRLQPIENLKVDWKGRTVEHITRAFNQIIDFIRTGKWLVEDQARYQLDNAVKDLKLRISEGKITPDNAGKFVKNLYKMNKILKGIESQGGEEKVRSLEREITGIIIKLEDEVIATKGKEPEAEKGIEERRTKIEEKKASIAERKRDLEERKAQAAKEKEEAVIKKPLPTPEKKVKGAEEKPKETSFAKMSEDEQRTVMKNYIEKNDRKGFRDYLQGQGIKGTKRKNLMATYETIAKLQSK